MWSYIWHTMQLNHHMINLWEIPSSTNTFSLGHICKLARIKVRYLMYDIIGICSSVQPHAPNFLLSASPCSTTFMHFSLVLVNYRSFAASSYKLWEHLLWYGATSYLKNLSLMMYPWRVLWKHLLKPRMLACVCGMELGAILIFPGSSFPMTLALWCTPEGV